MQAVNFVHQQVTFAVVDDYFEAHTSYGLYRPIILHSPSNITILEDEHKLIFR